MIRIPDFIPKKLARGPFALYTIILATFVLVIGFVVLEQEINVDLQFLVLLAILAHYWLIRARAAHYSPKKGVAYYYSTVVSGIAFLSVAFSWKSSSTPLYGYSSAMIAFYALYLFLSLPVLIGGSLRKQVAEKSAPVDDSNLST